MKAEGVLMVAKVEKRVVQLTLKGGNEGFNGTIADVDHESRVAILDGGDEGEVVAVDIDEISAVSWRFEHSTDAERANLVEALCALKKTGAAEA